jgi:hypothetical protein
MTVVAVTAKMFLSWLIHFSYVYFELSTKIAYFFIVIFFLSDANVFTDGACF